MNTWLKSFLFVVILASIIGLAYGVSRVQPEISSLMPDNSKYSTKTTPITDSQGNTFPFESGYTKFDETKITNTKHGKVILFFYASWCSACDSLDKDLQKNVDLIPPDMLIMKVNYDTEVELKQKYLITIQHALIHVDQSGNQVRGLQGQLQIDTLDELIQVFP